MGNFSCFVCFVVFYLLYQLGTGGKDKLDTWVEMLPFATKTLILIVYKVLYHKGQNTP